MISIFRVSPTEGHKEESLIRVGWSYVQQSLQLDSRSHFLGLLDSSLHSLVKGYEGLSWNERID